MSASSKEVALSSINPGPKNVPDTNDGSSLHVPQFALDSTYAKQRAIDSKIETMQSAMNTLSIQIAQAAKERNVFSPIAKLPTEIIILILVIVLDSASTDTAEPPYYRRLQLLAQVSTAWRDVITHTPIFWTVVEIGLNRQSYPTPLALKKAEELPLSVCYSTKYWEESTSDDACDREHIEVQNALRIVRAQDARWKSLYLQTTTLYSVLDFFRNKAPNLERLHVIISMHTDERWPQDVSLLEGYTTRLKEIKLENLPLSWEDNGLTVLRVLDLKRVRSADGLPTAAKILRILQACPELEILRLQKWRRLDETPEATEATVNLPQLRLIDLADNPLVVIAAIMQSVRAPSLHHLSLSTIDRISPLMLESYLTSHIPVLRRMISQADQVKISLGALELRVSVTRQEKILFDFGSRIYQATPSEFVPWLANHLPIPPTVKSASLSLGYGVSTQGPDVEPLGKWIPSLTKLEVSGLSKPMIEQLSEHTLRDGVPGWLWPGLRELRITGTGVTGANILRFLRKRYQSSPLQQIPPDSPSAGGGEEESVKEPNTPAMLDILHVRGGLTDMDDETCSQIYDIMGNDAFTWPR